MLKRFLPLLVVIVLAGCQATPTGPLAPLDYTFNADKTQTKEAIIATFLPRGYQIVRDSQFQLVLDRPANDSFGAQLLFGSSFNGAPNARPISRQARQ